jgi:hypothetical protein
VSADGDPVRQDDVLDLKRLEEPRKAIMPPGNSHGALPFCRILQGTGLYGYRWNWPVVRRTWWINLSGIIAFGAVR